MRIVLDTCVLVAALRSRRGASFGLLSAVGRGDVVPLLSVPLFLEYEAVLKQPGHLAVSGLTAPDVDVVLDVLAARGEARRLHFLWRPVLSDPADEMVLEVAVEGRADYIVTHNVRDFSKVADRFAIPVIVPAEVMRRMQT